MIKTKQELLNHFSDINAMYNNPFEYQTLSNMIDELLEQQPSDDCISRKDLLKRFEKECATDCSCCLYARDNDEIVEFGYREWCGLIEDAPSVTPKAEGE